MKTTVLVFKSRGEAAAFLRGVEFVNDSTIAFDRGEGDSDRIVVVTDEDDHGELEVREMSE